MDATEALRAAREHASKEAARIDAKVKDKLLKRGKHGMTDEREVTELVEAWKRAARHTKRLHLGRKGHSAKTVRL
jgi:hypothetical protein